MLAVTRVGKFLTTCAIVASLASCAAVSGRETPGEYMDDVGVTTRVRAAIVGDPSLKAMQVNVETMQSNVQLSGFVDSQRAKAHAGDVARGVRGVRSVRNDIVVR